MSDLNQFKTELLARIDIIDLIESRIHLRKKGSNHSALCPFHQEKTASFTVSQQKQFYHCFGCGAHGNAIDFLINYDRMEFMEALEHLAVTTGMTMPTFNSNKKQEKYTELYTMMEKIQQLFHKQLTNSTQAKQYLQQRGLTDNIINQYHLGFAPDQWDILVSYCQKNPKKLTQLITTGMAIRKSANKAYDRFRNRIIFPILDNRGRTIGFGGRTLGNEQPKYLNSPETPIYHKSRELYGLYQVRKSQNQLSRIIVVEGYMDVLVLAQHGVTNAVATLGTAVTSQHIQKILRYTNTIVFCFDGDLAGRAAAWRALTMTLPLMRDGIAAQFLFLPNKHDPDSYIREHGEQQFEQQLNQAIALDDWFFEHLMPKQRSDMQNKSKLAKEAHQLLAPMPNGIFKQLMQQRLADTVGVSIEQVQSKQPKPAASKQIPQPGNTNEIPQPVRLALLLLLQQPVLCQQITDIEKIKEYHLLGVDILIKCIEIIQKQPQITTGALLEYLRDEPQADLVAQLASENHVIPDAGIKHEFSGAIERIHELALDQTIAKLIAASQQNLLNTDDKQRLQALLKSKQQSKINETS